MILSHQESKCVGPVIREEESTPLQIVSEKPEHAVLVAVFGCMPSLCVEMELNNCPSTIYHH